MNTLIVILLIINAVTIAGAAAVASSEIRSLKVSIEKLSVLAEMNSHDICRSRRTIIQRMEDCRNDILNKNEELKVYIKECVAEEVPKTVFRLAFPAIPYRDKR